MCPWEQLCAPAQLLPGASPITTPHGWPGHFLAIWVPKAYPRRSKLCEAEDASTPPPAATPQGFKGKTAFCEPRNHFLPDPEPSSLQK